LWQPEPPTPERKWDEAVVRWLKEQAHKATAGEDVTKLRWLHPFLGGKHLEDIDRALIDRITQAKLAQGCANATVNRTLEVLRAILRKCVNDWEWLARAPKIRMLKQSTRRIRYLTREEAARLLAELPPHLADMATVSLATGLRAANVTGMEWTQVDFERRVAWVHPDQAKARRAIAIPLTDEVIAVLRSWEGKHPTHVFCFRGKPITQVSTKAWYGALKRAGIAQFRWHDLRHTWASWHVQVGTPLFALQEMAGWESAEMVRRYAHLNAGHLAPYADRLGAVRAAQ
jgi:integrase